MPDRMKKLLAVLTLFLASTAVADVWQKIDETLPELVKQGYDVVAFDVDSGVDVYSGTTFRYILSNFETAKTRDECTIVLCTETSKGSHHQCWRAR